MAENLKVTKYRNGDLIPNVKDSVSWGKLTSGAWCYNNNDSLNNKDYGKLYNFYATNDQRGLCPIGWHIPTGADIVTLENYLGGNKIMGGKLKEAGLGHWKSPNLGADNSTGFTGLPGGTRRSGTGYSQDFVGIGGAGIWFLNDAVGDAASFGMEYGSLQFYGEGGLNKNIGFSVRCIKE